jgi:DNA-binding transcriptional regulator GbsR (MarR family)
MDKKEKLEKNRDKVIETISNNMDLYGVTPSIGRLYGAMYFHDEPMTLDEMKDILGMSKTSMSTGVRTLLELKMVKKVWVKGKRKDFYQVEQDWYQSFIDLFCIKWRKGIDVNTSTIKKALSELDELINSEDTSEDVKQMALTDKKKLQHAFEYYDWLSRLIDTFESKEIYNLIPPKKER